VIGIQSQGSEASIVILRSPRATGYRRRRETFAKREGLVKSLPIPREAAAAGDHRSAR
jgi:hypothetical protein